MNLDRLGPSTLNTLAFAEEVRGLGATSGVSNLGSGDVDTTTPALLRLPRAHGDNRSRERIASISAKRTTDSQSTIASSRSVHSTIVTLTVRPKTLELLT